MKVISMHGGLYYQPPAVDRNTDTGMTFLESLSHLWVMLMRKTCTQAAFNL